MSDEKASILTALFRAKDTLLILKLQSADLRTLYKTSLVTCDDANFFTDQSRNLIFKVAAFSYELKVVNNFFEGLLKSDR